MNEHVAYPAHLASYVIEYLSRKAGLTARLLSGELKTKGILVQVKAPPSAIEQQHADLLERLGAGSYEEALGRIAVLGAVPAVDEENANGG